MMRLGAFAMLLAAPSLFAAPVPKEVRKVEKFEGTWKVVGLDSRGTANAIGDDSYWTIDDAGMLHLHTGAARMQGVPSNIRMTFDRKLRSVNYTELNGGHDYPGLFEIDGDTLKMCFTLTGAVRPAAIGTGPDINLWTFKRVDPEGRK
jgi:uncharacterized protein (TIGR03067 family)